MFSYVIRRLLLMIPTFFGTTLLVFVILQSVPSGPFEQAVMQIKMAKIQSGEGQNTTSDDRGTMELSEEVLEITEGKGADAVLELVGTELTLPKS